MWRMINVKLFNHYCIPRWLYPVLEVGVFESTFFIEIEVFVDLFMLPLEFSDVIATFCCYTVLSKLYPKNRPLFLLIKFTKLTHIYSISKLILL